MALIARGDTYDEIEAQTGVNRGQLTSIKKRNIESIQEVKNKLLEREVKTQAKIKQHANNKIEERLNRDDKLHELMEKVTHDYLKGELTLKDYTQAILSLKELTVSDLIQISREMHVQSGTEEKPPTSPEDLTALSAALASGDQVTLTQILFHGKRSNPLETPILTV